LHRKKQGTLSILSVNDVKVVTLQSLYIQANAVMSSLMSIAPQKAVIAETGEDVDVDEVRLNTILAVKAGEIIPIDGVVIDGDCEVDEKTLTGESFPVAKQKDSTVWAGTINLNGKFLVFIGTREDIK